MDDRVIRLTEADAARAGAVLGRAFRDDPFHVYFLPDATARARRLPALYASAIRFGCRYGEVWGVEAEPGGALIGVGLWLPAPGGEWTPERMADVDMSLPDLLGADAAARLEEPFAAIEAALEHAVPQPHWYLSNIGVDPGWQRRGVGAALVRRFAARAAADRVPGCFWTVQPMNVPFYRRLGFTIATEGVEPTSQLPYWVFRR
jgi:ribosomal protein S18 acetylase RimI-like enzyme